MAKLSVPGDYTEVLPFKAAFNGSAYAVVSLKAY
jgi:hypothetical protein